MCMRHAACCLDIPVTVPFTLRTSEPLYSLWPCRWALSLDLSLGIVLGIVFGLVFGIVLGPFSLALSLALSLDFVFGIVFGMVLALGPCRWHCLWHCLWTCLRVQCGGGCEAQCRGLVFLCICSFGRSAVRLALSAPIVEEVGLGKILLMRLQYLCSCVFDAAM